MHQHGQFQRPGAVIRIAKEHSETECRYGLPWVQMQDGEEQGGDDYGR